MVISDVGDLRQHSNIGEKEIVNDYYNESFDDFEMP